MTPDEFKIVSSLTPEQVEYVIRVWEKNHTNKLFEMVDKSNLVYPQKVRVIKAFKDKNEGWCVTYNDAVNYCPAYFRKFNLFISEYACQK